MTSLEAKANVLEMIPTDFGKSFDKLKKDILKTVEFGASNHFKSKNGYSIFYTSNPNFMMGANNGGGSGFFARLYSVGMCRDIKLSN